jgi:EAL domain-containing protein (putative c-di-GMP-specific phosphodiesterase class I)/ActR/RegA family two-component response regulator
MRDDLFGDRLLVIDDEPALGNAVKRIAQGCGFEVVVTENPATFINAARLWHPTVIVLDLKIPGADGIELLRMLAADKSPAHIILSSGSDEKVLDTALRLALERGLNMGEVLPKPVRADSLRERLFALKRLPKLQVSADLSRAIADGQLFLEFQPKLDCRTSRLTGVEALVRWNHPTFGIVPPDQFGALADEMGLMRRLTEWVVGAAAAQAAHWRAEQLACDIAVNISATDVEDLEFPERLDQLCRNAGLDPASMTLELTETSALREAVQVMDVLTRLRLRGFKLSIDDFGTGYSSLVQLERMPFSEIKIDKSFVQRMTSNHGCKVIVEIVIDLARKLGLTSVAEGVEDQATLDRLIELGCDAAQGYHIARPLPADRVTELLRGQPGQPGRQTSGDPANEAAA